MKKQTLKAFAVAISLLISLDLAAQEMVDVMSNPEPTDFSARKRQRSRGRRPRVPDQTMDAHSWSNHWGGGENGWNTWGQPAPTERAARGASGCEHMRSTVSSVVGYGAADCYLKLFKHETGCRAHLTQRKGNAGNANVGYGICTLEKSAAVRRANRRGPECEDISTVESQIRCCQAIMRRTPHYFGPVNRGKVPRCG